MTFNKKKYDQAYVKNNYDRINLNVKKGDKDIIATHAQKKGFNSITDYIKHLIYNDMNNEKSNISIRDINQSGDNNNITIG